MTGDDGLNVKRTEYFITGCVERRIRKVARIFWPGVQVIGDLRIDHDIGLKDVTFFEVAPGKHDIGPSVTIEIQNDPGRLAAVVSGRFIQNAR
ncbi:MAG: hypothetical protein M1457_09690 [bacterium]|nr:hypothetical protein [bacterium]